MRWDEEKTIFSLSRIYKLYRIEMDFDKRFDGSIFYMSFVCTYGDEQIYHSAARAHHPSVLTTFEGDKCSAADAADGIAIHHSFGAKKTVERTNEELIRTRIW